MKPARASPCPARAWTQRPVVKDAADPHREHDRVPELVQGSSFRKESNTARRTMLGSNRGRAWLLAATFGVLLKP